jgi:hypothetical protein
MKGGSGKGIQVQVQVQIQNPGRPDEWWSKKSHWLAICFQVSSESSFAGEGNTHPFHALTALREGIYAGECWGMLGIGGVVDVEYVPHGVVSDHENLYKTLELTQPTPASWTDQGTLRWDMRRRESRCLKTPAQISLPIHQVICRECHAENEQSPYNNPMPETTMYDTIQPATHPSCNEKKEN